MAPRTNAISFYKKLKEKGAKNVEFELLKGYQHGTTLTKYSEPGDKAAEVINRFLSVYLPVNKNQCHTEK